jgi:Na+/proline symporter
MIFWKLDFNVPQIYATLVEDNKLQMFDFNLNCNSPTIYVIILSLIGGLVPYTSDQSVVQRYLTTKDEKAAAKGVWASAIISIPASLLFFCLGTCLYSFYKAYPSMLSPVMASNDSILPLFIIRELPVGISGLVIAGVFAAAMSSLDSGMNSVATSFVTDFYRRFVKNSVDHRCLQIAKVITFFTGLFVIVLSILMIRSDVKSLWDNFMAILGLFGGGVAGLFILGILTKRVDSSCALIGFFSSAIIQYLVSKNSDVHFFLYATIGVLSCVVIGYMFSFFVSCRNKTYGTTIFGR